jgi:hypothetical protein
MGSTDTAYETIRFFCLNLRFGLADDGPDNWENRKRCYFIIFLQLTLALRAPPASTTRS